MVVLLISKLLSGKEKLEQYFSGIWNPEQFSVSITSLAREPQADNYSIRSLITVTANGRSFVRERLAR